MAAHPERLVMRWKAHAMRLSRQRAMPAAVWGACLVLSSLLLTGAVYRWLEVRGLRLEVAEEVAQLRRTLDARGLAPTAGPDTPAPPGDFTQGLPASPDMRPVLMELAQSSRNAGVVLGGVQLQDHAATAEQLARTDATVSLHGHYPQLKLVVLDVLGSGVQSGYRAACSAGMSLS